MTTRRKVISHALDHPHHRLKIDGCGAASLVPAAFCGPLSICA